MAIKKRHLVFTGLIASTAILFNAQRLHARHPGTDAHYNNTQITNADLRYYVQTYSEQGRHRSGSEVDKSNAIWLRQVLQDHGYKVNLEPVRFQRSTAPDANIKFKILNDRVLLGMPMLNSKATGASGLSAKLGTVNEQGVVPIFYLYVSLPNGRITGKMIKENHTQFKQLLASHQYPAILAITQGVQAGLAPMDINLNNSYDFPVIFVSSSHGSLLERQAKLNKKIHIISRISRKPATAYNVVATLQGSDPQLRPIVVMVARSAWYKAAGERGTSVAAWLATAVAQKARHPKRSVIFVALTGSELGHLGYKAFMQQHSELKQRAKAWIYISGNIATSAGSKYVIKTSTKQLKQMVGKAFSENHIQNMYFLRHTGALSKNAGTLFISGMKNNCYHLTCDMYPDNVDMHADFQFADALNTVISRLDDASSVSQPRVEHEDSERLNDM